jgi:uncharacterized membrane protein YccC
MLLLPLLIFLSYYLKSFSYTASATFITTMAILFINVIVPNDWMASIVRLICTFIGAIAGIVVAFCIVPTKSQAAQRKRFTQLMNNFAERLLCLLQPPQRETIIATTMVIHKNLVAFDKDVEESKVELFAKQRKHLLERAHKLVYIMHDNMILLLEYRMEATEHSLYQENADFIKNLVNELANVCRAIGEFKPSNFSKDQEQFKQLTTLLQQAMTYRMSALAQTTIPLASLTDLINFTYFLQSLKMIYLALNKLALLSRTRQ